jgi:hypothetical protein
MGQGTVAQTFALQKEKVRPQLTLLYQLDDTLWSEIESRGDVEVVSSRPTRIPLELLAGGTFTTNTPDGGDLGLGSAPITDFMTLVPAYFFQCSQWTKQAEISTNSNEKAIEDYSKLVMKRAMKNFRTYMEAVFTQGAGDNMLDVVATTASAGAVSVIVKNANQFQDQQPIDVWTATGGTYVTSFIVQSVDAANKTLWLNGPLAVQCTAGYGLYVKGSAGVANSGLFGIFQAAVSANSGTCFSLSRASYPGKLTMPYVSGGNQPITPSTARKLTGQMQIALGSTAAFELDLQINMGPDQMAAWENTAIQVASIIQNQIKGDESEDMLKKHSPKTFMGYPIVNKGLGNIHAKQGRIDGVCLKCWVRVENQPIDFLEYGGQTVFPQYGASGGLSASTFFYLWTGVNAFMDNPRAGFFCDSLSVPTGY